MINWQTWTPLISKGIGNSRPTSGRSLKGRDMTCCEQNMILVRDVRTENEKWYCERCGFQIEPAQADDPGYAEAKADLAARCGSTNSNGKP